MPRNIQQIFALFFAFTLLLPSPALAQNPITQAQPPQLNDEVIVPRNAEEAAAYAEVVASQRELIRVGEAIKANKHVEPLEMDAILKRVQRAMLRWSELMQKRPQVNSVAQQPVSTAPVPVTPPQPPPPTTVAAAPAPPPQVSIVSADQAPRSGKFMQDFELVLPQAGETLTLTFPQFELAVVRVLSHTPEE